MQHVENELDITLEKLTQTATKLDEKLKAYALAEGEIQALKRKISLLEDELERSESKGTITTKELSEASALKDSIDKALKTLETKNMIDEQRIDISENQLKEAKQMVEESDIKYDEVARKLPLVKDYYWDKQDCPIPYTEAAMQFKKKTYRGSADDMKVPEDKCHMVLPEIEEEAEEDTKLSLTSLLLESSNIMTNIGLGNIDAPDNGREEGDPSPMGYGRRGPAASGAWRNGNGGLGA